MSESHSTLWKQWRLMLNFSFGGGDVKPMRPPPPHTGGDGWESGKRKHSGREMDLTLGGRGQKEEPGPLLLLPAEQELCSETRLARESKESAKQPRGPW